MTFGVHEFAPVDVPELSAGPAADNARAAPLPRIRAASMAASARIVRLIYSSFSRCVHDPSFVTPGQ
jgi:hypothetical protein